MRYFVATELGVANLLQRHFDWSSNALWYEEIPNARDPAKTLFVLGAKDKILNASVSYSVITRVRHVLTSCLSVSRNISNLMESRRTSGSIPGATMVKLCRQDQEATN